MKKTILITALLIAALFSALSARAQYRVELSDVRVDRGDNRVVVSFSGRTSRRTIGGDGAVAIQPVITDGTYRVSLTPVVVRGRRAKISHERGEWISGATTTTRPTTFAAGDSFEYRAEAEFQSWMEEADLTLEGLSLGCGTASPLPSRVLARAILPAAAKTPAPAPEPPTQPEPADTTGDLMAKSFSFVLPETAWNGDNIFANRDRAQVIYYRVGSYLIEPSFSNNHLMLNNLDAAVEAILSSGDSRVSRIVVAGFASPEGSFDLNDRLAWNRAQAVKERIVRNSGIDPSLISIYNGSEDWAGLREIVESSSLYDRERILRIIDTAPALSADGRRKPRLEQIKALDGGRTYRYMLENYFPRLRNGAFIQVYYRDK
ncbi:MAG: hypothetical protein LBV38_00640 [Alistipes sp.]|jgi:outer membrane protein OmpA-like peptidoglycan-associated protein|nr:hypothetical protein [Alistipes sp.]